MGENLFTFTLLLADFIVSVGVFSKEKDLKYNICSTLIFYLVKRLSQNAYLCMETVTEVSVCTMVMKTNNRDAQKFSEGTIIRYFLLLF